MDEGEKKSKRIEPSLLCILRLLDLLPENEKITSTGHSGSVLNFKNHSQSRSGYKVFSANQFFLLFYALWFLTYGRNSHVVL